MVIKGVESDGENPAARNQRVFPPSAAVNIHILSAAAAAKTIKE